MGETSSTWRLHVSFPGLGIQSNDWQLLSNYLLHDGWIVRDQQVGIHLWCSHKSQWSTCYAATGNPSYSLVIKHGNGKAPLYFENVPILECKVYSGFSSHAWLPEGISIQEHFKSGLQLCLWQQRHGSLPVLRRSARCDQGTVPGIPSKHSTQRSKTALSFHLPQKKKHHLPSLAAKLEGL